MLLTPEFFYKGDLRVSELSFFLGESKEYQNLNNFLSCSDFTSAKNEIITIIYIILSKYLDIKICDNTDKEILMLFPDVLQFEQLETTQFRFSSKKLVFKKKRSYIKWLNIPSKNDKPWTWFKERLIYFFLYIIDQFKSSEKNILYIYKNTEHDDIKRMLFNFIYFDKKEFDDSKIKEFDLKLRTYEFLTKSDWKIEKIFWIARFKEQDKNCFLNLLPKDLIIVILKIIFPKKYGFFLIKKN